MKSESLKRSSIASTVWKLMERILAQGITFVVSLVLARLLEPTDYSVVGIINIFFAFANLLVSGGLNTALIQKKDADERDYSTVLTGSLILSAVLYVLLFFTSPLIAELYGQPILVWAIRIMGLTLPVNAAKAVYCAKVSSELRFKKFFWATLCGAVLSAAVGLGMAYGGMGAWALIAQQVTSITVNTVILFFTVPLRLKLRIYKDRFKGLFGYGWKILTSSLIATLYTELTPLIIGLKYSAVDLSFYTKGRSFPGLVSTISTDTLGAVLFPVLSKCQDDRERLLHYTRLYVRMASYLAFPMMVGLMCVSENFILLLLTEKWLPAVPYMRIFCLVFMFDMINVGNCEAIKALGRSDVYLLIEIIKKTLYFAVIIVFLLLSHDPIALSVSFVICALIALVVNSVPNISLLGYTLGKQLADILPNLILSLVMGAAVLAVGQLSLGHYAVELAVQVAVGVAVYLGLSLVTKNQCLTYGWQSAREYFKR